jgi:hypothetical protein
MRSTLVIFVSSSEAERTTQLSEPVVLRAYDKTGNQQVRSRNVRQLKHTYLDQQDRRPRPKSSINKPSLFL